MWAQNLCTSGSHARSISATRASLSPQGAEKRVEMALDAGPHASFARLHSAASALDGRFAGPVRGAKKGYAFAGGAYCHDERRDENSSAREMPHRGHPLCFAISKRAARRPL
jgi:hypothetical protein